MVAVARSRVEVVLPSPPSRPCAAQTKIQSHLPHSVGVEPEAACRLQKHSSCTGERVLGRQQGARRLGVTCHRVIQLLSVLVLLLGCAGTRAAETHETTGAGMFRFGHVSWESEGTTVFFTIETAFRKNVSKAEWVNARVGDRLLLMGKEPPQFLYGDSQFASSLHMEVTAVSQTEDWAMGVVRLKHIYATPNNEGWPWRAQYVGCCRVSILKNNAGLGFEITAEVDLTMARRSPRAATLPILTVPLQSRDSALPGAYIPSRSGSDVEWSAGTPIDVGSVAAFSSTQRSFLTLPLRALKQAGGACAQNSTGAECLVQMVSADLSVAPGAMTIEGWLRLNKRRGGYLFSSNHSCGGGKRVSTLCVYP